MSAPRPLLHRVLAHPAEAAALDDAGWHLLVGQARSAAVLGRTLSAVAARIGERALPPCAAHALTAERNLAAHRCACLRWEVEELARVLAPLGVPVILLKGAAYVIQGHDWAHWRHFGDIDILLPATTLPDAERLLAVNGWIHSKRDDYDQAYYRRWMHELPPLQHLLRGTALDVHHTIVPRTARYRPPAEKLFENARGLPADDRLATLSASDQFLHAATHLFTEGEADMALRNLVDLHDLLCSGSAQDADGFAAALCERAATLDLIAPLALAARHLHRQLGSMAAAAVSAELTRNKRIPAFNGALDWMFDATFRGHHPSMRSRSLGSASALLYLRGHWLRMPATLLAAHLTRKLLRLSGNGKSPP